MIKKIFIVFTFIFIGCNQLVEKTSPLEGIYYILDGWDKFQEEDYDRAHDLFSTVLLNNNTQYFGEAYLGLAWNSIYKANTIQGVPSFSDRQYQRDISNQYFNLASEYIQDSETCSLVDDCESSSLCKNLLAGQTYNSSYQALEASTQFYDYGLDSSNWVDMTIYSDSTIYYSNWLFNECNPNEDYEFEYDSAIDYKSIRILRAQTYARLADFDSAYSELILIDDLNCNFNTQTVIECLNSLDFE